MSALCAARLADRIPEFPNGKQSACAPLKRCQMIVVLHRGKVFWKSGPRKAFGVACGVSEVETGADKLSELKNCYGCERVVVDHGESLRHGSLGFRWISCL